MVQSGGNEKKRRDPRLDFFRGVCLVIIYIAHIWDNPWALFIPARFGFSDATEIFVFCSGMASAAAFGDVFVRRGMVIGLARIAHRCWQVYWSHVGMFLVGVALMVAADLYFETGGSYLNGLGLGPAFGAHSREVVLGLLSLTFVPHFFDILPMYLVILALLPLVVMAANIHQGLAFGGVAAVWLVASSGCLDLPAEPWSIGTSEAKTWFFNPFSWQLIFFTGFAFMRGWLPAPPVHRRLVALCGLFIVAAVPLSWHMALNWSPLLHDAHASIASAIDKTHLGLLRYSHFLCLAYLAFVAVGDGGNRLVGRPVDVLRQVGQQSLAVFMTGLVLSFLASIMLNYMGRGVLPVAIVNLGGIAILVGVARVIAWFSSSPWKQESTPIRVAVTINEPARNN